MQLLVKCYDDKMVKVTLQLLTQPQVANQQKNNNGEQK